MCAVRIFFFSAAWLAATHRRHSSDASPGSRPACTAPTSPTMSSRPMSAAVSAPPPAGKSAWVAAVSEAHRVQAQVPEVPVALVHETHAPEAPEVPEVPEVPEAYVALVSEAHRSCCVWLMRRRGGTMAVEWRGARRTRYAGSTGRWAGSADWVSRVRSPVRSRRAPREASLARRGRSRRGGRGVRPRCGGWPRRPRGVPRRRPVRRRGPGRRRRRSAVAAVRRRRPASIRAVR
jgi:hypothetical protein